MRRTQPLTADPLDRLLDRLRVLQTHDEVVEAIRDGVFARPVESIAKPSAVVPGRLPTWEASR